MTFGEPTVPGEPSGVPQEDEDERQWAEWMAESRRQAAELLAFWREKHNRPDLFWFDHAVQEFGQEREFDPISIRTLRSEMIRAALKGELIVRNPATLGNELPRSADGLHINYFVVLMRDVRTWYRRRFKAQRATASKAIDGMIAQRTASAESPEQRQEQRIRACESAGLRMPARPEGRLPNGIGRVAKSLGISRQSLSQDLKAGLEHRVRQRAPK